MDWSDTPRVSTWFSASVNKRLLDFVLDFFLAKIQAELEGFYGCFVPLMQFETPIAFFWG
jgi:hypothetical protein